MPTSIRKLFSADPAKKDDGLTQVQREAIVDLLHYCMFADNFVALAEDKFVNSVAASLTWDKAITFESYEGGSIGKARKAKESAGYRESFLKDVAARLSSPTSRALARDLCQDLYKADAKFAQAESDQLVLIRQLLK
ncbi:MAG TPA: hypothetical protein VEB66_08590 [Opitutaceae bacterium]|nr:hypothetical protein [Opitutaceae bacterium]